MYKLNDLNNLLAKDVLWFEPKPFTGDGQIKIGSHQYADLIKSQIKNISDKAKKHNAEMTALRNRLSEQLKLMPSWYAYFPVLRNKRLEVERKINRINGSITEYNDSVDDCIEAINVMHSELLSHTEREISIALPSFYRIIRSIL
jgi:hypothetical protein